MIKLNLTANNEAEKRIKEYLENNVSETLADKINNGVTITKDNKELINKEWVRKYDVPSIVVDKIKQCCKQGNSEEQNVRAWHEWMDDHVGYWSYSEHQYSIEQVINQGGGNCVDNSRVFRAGCLALGVKCRYMQGRDCCAESCASGHQWNMVYFSNGKKVVVDNGRGDASWGSHWASCSGGEWETDDSW